MRTALFARTLAIASLVAASCQSDMPSIKKSELVSWILLLVLGFAGAVLYRPIPKLYIHLQRV